MTRLLAFAFVLAITARTTHAQPSAQTPAHPAFKPLEFLVGSCWIGTFPDGKQTDEHCFEWVYDRKFIRDRHVVRGGPPYQGETVYRVDPRTSAVSYWYISSDGMVITGTVEDTKDGLVFPSQYTTATGVVDLRSIWVPSGNGSYKVRSLQRDGQTWKELWAMEMRRQTK